MHGEDDMWNWAELRLDLEWLQRNGELWRRLPDPRKLQRLQRVPMRQ
jgi:hypothetical protein